MVLVLLAHALRYGRRSTPAAGASVERTRRRFSRWDHWVLRGLAVGIAISGVTGLLGAFSGGIRESLLLVHMFGAAVFIVSVTVAAVTFAERCRFTAADGVWLRAGGGFFGSRERGLPAGYFDAGQKVFLWLLLAVGFVVLTSMMLSMTSWFGQECQRFLYGIHRYGGLLIVLLSLVHGYAVAYAQPGAWRAALTGRASEQWIAYYHPLWWQDLEEKGKAGDDDVA